MGLTVRLSVMSVYFAGELFDLNAGYNFAHQIDPTTHENAGPLQQLCQLAAGLLFFAVGGQQQVIMALARSFERTPPGAVVWHNHVPIALLHQVGFLFAQGLRIAAPILAALIAAQLFLALLSRVAPQLNIWGVGFAIISGVAVLGLLYFTPAWVAHVAAIWQQSGTRMLTVWNS